MIKQLTSALRQLFCAPVKTKEQDEADHIDKLAGMLEANIDNCIRMRQTYKVQETIWEFKSVYGNHLRAQKHLYRLQAKLTAKQNDLLK